MATRFKLTNDATAPAVSPALQSYSHTQTTRRKLLLADTSALATTAYTPDGADHLVAGDAHHIQFVSDQMASGNVFTSGNTLKFAIQGLEAHTGNNLQVQLFVSVVDSAGTTVRATLRSKVLDGLELATSLTSRFLSTTLSAGYTTVANDRLVVEFSVSGTPTGAGGVQGHNASLRWGGNGAGGDLLENDTQTGTTLNPWIEFLTTIVWPAVETPVTLAVTATLTPVITRQVSYLRTLAVAATFTPALVTGLVFQKLLEVTSAMTAAVSTALVFGRTLAVESVMAPVLSRAVTFRQTLAATGSWIGGLVTEFIDGGGPTLARLMALLGVGR